MSEDLPSVGDEKTSASDALGAPVVAVDVDALVQSAVRRIADAITPVAVLEPARALSHVEPEPVAAASEPTSGLEAEVPAAQEEPAVVDFASESGTCLEGQVEGQLAQSAPESVGTAEPGPAHELADSASTEPGDVAEEAAVTTPVAAPPAAGVIDPTPGAEHIDVPPGDEHTSPASDETLPPDAAPLVEADRGDPPIPIQEPEKAPTILGATLSVEPLAGQQPTGEPSASPVPGFMQGPWTWRRVARLAGLAVAAYFGVVLFLILLYRFINPPTTTLIAYQWLTGTTIEQEWVPIEDISSNLLRAVVVSEDWGFCDHYGVDLDAIEKALELAGEGKVARGASTISMQVIKNLFLSQSKSYLRKAVEIPLTFVAEAVWPKSRMLEIYLNIAEWGPGVFGAEAAAQHHFSKHASQLSQREAALLAAALPNPILRDAGDPSTRTARKASVIQSRMRAAGPVADCAMTGRQRTSNAESGAERDPPAGWQTTVKKRAGGT